MDETPLMVNHIVLGIVGSKFPGLSRLSFSEGAVFISLEIEHAWRRVRFPGYGEMLSTYLN